MITLNHGFLPGGKMEEYERLEEEKGEWDYLYVVIPYQEIKRENQDNHWDEGGILRWKITPAKNILLEGNPIDQVLNDLHSLGWEVVQRVEDIDPTHCQFFLKRRKSRRNPKLLPIFFLVHPSISLRAV